MDIVRTNAMIGWDALINLGCILSAAAGDNGPTVFQDPIAGLDLWVSTRKKR